MKLKILSNGTIAGTIIINAETGEKLKNVKQISFEADVDTNQVSVKVAFDGIELELIPEADIDEYLKHIRNSNRDD